MPPTRFLSCSSLFSAGALAALFLAGCGTLDPVVDTTRYYTLAPAASGAATVSDESDTTRIGVRVSVQPDYLRRPAIAVRTSENELRLENDHRWAENLNEGVARVLAQDLQSRLPHAIVAPVSGGGMTSGSTVIVDVTIVACEGSGAGTVLEAYWRVDSHTGNMAGASGRFREMNTGWDGTDFGALAAQLSALVDQLAAKIAAATDW